MMKALIMAGAVASLSLALTGCGSAPSAAPTPTETRTRLQIAAAGCLKGDAKGVDIMDEGKSIELRTVGEDYLHKEGLELDDVNCVLKATGVSSATLAKMGHTRALDGTQTASWDGFEASWSYHPDNGMAVVLEDKK